MPWPESRRIQEQVTIAVIQGAPYKVHVVLIPSDRSAWQGKAHFRYFRVTIDLAQLCFQVFVHGEVCEAENVQAFVQNE